MKNIGFKLGILTVIIHIISLCGFSYITYKLYHNFIFRFIRIVYDNTLGYLPFASLYLFLTIVFITLICIGYHVYWILKNQSPWPSTKKMVMISLNFIGWVYFLFYFLWAFNYYGPSIKNRLGWQEMTPDSSAILKELNFVTDKVNSLRIHLSQNTSELHFKPDWNTLENNIRISEASLLQSWGIPTYGRVRIRRLQPPGILLRISTAGVYIPFVCEGHIDSGMNALQWPFTLAHEMAHGYGFTDEGECNFIGFLTSINSNDPYVNYSGWLAYWRYLYFDVYSLSESNAEVVFDCLFLGVKADLKAIRADVNKYPDIFPSLRDGFYELYLKFHGVNHGLKSYNEIIELVLTWKKNERVTN
ncbi:MAG: DUF3810 domain-containing protein [Saprospiraceae bacterium]|nr:DUF3810 domain-containing protein [Saprospiraceae bacterium]